MSVADDPETARIKHNTQIQSNVSYWGLRDQRTEQEKKRPNEVTDEGEKNASIALFWCKIEFIIMLDVVGVCLF